MPRAAGARKNLALTLWLILPFAVVGILIASIFWAYARGPAMDARPVGAGAGDTGGANAIGELLAGKNVGELQQQRRDLREGRLVDPLEWPGGIYVVLRGATTAVGDVYLISWTGDSADEPEWHTHAGFAEPVPAPEARNVVGNVGAGMTLPQGRVAAITGSPHPAAGFYASPIHEPRRTASGLVDAQGKALPRVEFPLVERSDRSTDQPLAFIVAADFSADPPVRVEPMD